MDSYPLPHIDELLSKLCGATVFSTIDLESAYFQLPLHEESRDLTAFITHEGLFRFCRVPFGLALAPSAFQKMLSTVLQGLTNVAHYLDDVIVWGRTPSEHDCMLNKVVQLLQSAGLQLNTPKCQFSKTSLRFLGHTVSAQGVHPNEDHLNAMLHAPVPTDAHQLRSFLGLISWYSKFIPKFSKPLQITRQIGSCTYQLSDGKKWHASHLSPTVAPLEYSTKNELVALPLHMGSSSTSGVLLKNEQSNSPIQVPLSTDPSTVPGRGSARVRRPPRWLQDYVT